MALLTAPLTLAPALLAAPLAASSWGDIARAEERQVPQINVTGEASINVAPDLAMIDLGVVREADTARQALSDDNAAMAEVIAAMKEAGIEDRDLQTSGFSIQPKYVYDPPKSNGPQKPPRIVGYTVTNNLSVRIRDLARLGEILDRSVSLGVNSGGSISFGNDDPSAEIARARTAAMKDAVDRAKTLVEAAGAKLGPILSINENFQTPRPMPMARGKMMAEAMSADVVPVAGGENTYSVTVSASWEIQQ
ncbi:MAG: SIMPL domain-containing protein [Nitratireductor sp.]|nr:SIMPL domain-containing protein [Nitratireductor sp.]